MTVGLYINDPGANIQRFVRCLTAWRMSFVSIWRDDLAAITTDDVDVLLLHGGWYGIDRQPGQTQHEVVTKPGDEVRGAAVRGFVEAGGGVVGVCAGAYNVVWLGLIAAEISRAQGCGMHALEVTQPTHPIAAKVVERTEDRTDRDWQPVPVIRVNGPIFFPADKQTMIFSYDWEQRLGAVLAAPYGRGRAVAISPHPERSEHDVQLGGAIPEEPLLRAAGILEQSLIWAAGNN